MKKNHRRHAGFFLVDTVFGFVIASVLATALVVAITSAGRAERRLEDGAQAMRIAERAMATLREGKTAPAEVGDARIVVKSAAGAQKVAGREWVEVVVEYHGRRASLTGLAPMRGGK